MSLSFYIGGAGSGKTTKLQEMVIEKSMQEPEKQFLFLVPDQYTMQVQKELVLRHPNRGFFNIDVVSFSRLYYKLLSEVGGKARLLLDDTGKNLILRKLALDLEDELLILGKSMRKIGYVHEVKSLISEFMQYGLSPEKVAELYEETDLAADGIANGNLHGTTNENITRNENGTTNENTNGSGNGTTAIKLSRNLKNKLRDTNQLYKAFLAYLGDKYITTEETMDVLCELLPKSSMVKNSIVVLDGFTGFTPVQYKVIAELLNLSQEMYVSVTLRSGDEKEPWFRLSNQMKYKLEELAKNYQIPRGKDVCLQSEVAPRLVNAKELAFLEKNLFRIAKTPLVYEGENEQVHLQVAKNPREEVRYVCQQICQIITEKKLAYRDFAIVTGDLERYAPAIEELMLQYEIPFFMDQTRKLQLNPFAEYIKSALLLIYKNFSYEGVMHYLKSGLTDLSWEEIDALDNYLLALNIRGQNRWNKPFERYASYMKEDEEKLQEMNQIRVKILESLKPLCDLKLGGGKRKHPKEEKASVISQAVLTFIQKNQVEEKLAAYEKMFEEKKDRQREKEYSQVYPQILQLLEQMNGLLGDDLLTLEEYIRILEAGITEISIGIIPLEVDYVQIGDLQRTRLRETKVLFFLGLNDGVVPQKESKGGIISDFDRELLAEAGVELSPTPREKMYMQRLYLYMLLSKPTEALYVSYSVMDGEGTSLRPSYLVDLLRGYFPKLTSGGLEEAPLFDTLRKPKQGEECIADLIRDYAADLLGEENKELLYSLYRVLQEKNPTLISALTEAAFYQYQSKRLGKELSMLLYGVDWASSVSRLERFAQCAYSHFLQYGMELKERENFEFAMLDMGNIYHEVLDGFGKELEKRNLSWTEFEQPEADDILEDLLENITGSYQAQKLYQDPRTEYQLVHMKKILKRSIYQLQYQLKKGKFVPKHFEASFQELIDLSQLRDEVSPELTAKDKMRIRGKIDRIDVCELENMVYLKVVDYKSSKKKIELLEVYRGTQLQLLVYMDQALGKERTRQKSLGSKKEVLPGAIFYYPMLYPYYNAKEEKKDMESWLNHQLRMSGLYVEKPEVMKGLDDLEASGEKESDVVRMKYLKSQALDRYSQNIKESDLQTMLDYADYKVKELGRDLLLGEMAARPMSEKSCEYCVYREICGFDCRIAGYEYKEDQDFTELESKKPTEDELLKHMKNRINK